MNKIIVVFSFLILSITLFAGIGIAYDWSTPFYAIVKFQAVDGTLDHITINSFEASSIDYAKFKGWLWTYMGDTEWYHGARFYAKGYLTNGERFLISIIPTQRTVSTYEFTHDRIYFKSENVKVFFFNYDTGYSFRTNMDVVRFSIVPGDTEVDMAGGNGDEFADDIIRINDMNLDYFDYQCYISSWCP